ncbi:glycine-rich domain-containing protein [Streptomyces sp. bgisy091]|uniref:glycine-rich domain-containing protein n=1 Tax=Streptomyces sp. bgisy091 TaxID=3413778 RepID=UPI003D72ADB7
MTAVANETKTGRALVDEELFGSITNFVMQHDGETLERAERITHQALAYVATVATATVTMMPSDDVDKGLHAFILHTKVYAEFCNRHAGRFLHHNPAPAPVEDGRPLNRVQATTHAMKAGGFMVFDDLWTVDGTNAAQCDSDDGRDY